MFVQFPLYRQRTSLLCGIPSRPLKRFNYLVINNIFAFKLACFYEVLYLFIIKSCKPTKYKSPAKVCQASLFLNFEVMLSPKNSLYKLANLIDWDVFEQSFSPLYSKDTGRMAKPIRLIAGPLILKHLRDISDESIEEQFSENAYLQYFCGMEAFRPI